jgi:hypothetical protein
MPPRTLEHAMKNDWDDLYGKAQRDEAITWAVVIAVILLVKLIVA